LHDEDDDIKPEVAIVIASADEGVGFEEGDGGGGLGDVHADPVADLEGEGVDGGAHAGVVGFDVGAGGASEGVGEEEGQRGEGEDDAPKGGAVSGDANGN